MKMGESFERIPVLEPTINGNVKEPPDGHTQSPVVAEWMISDPFNWLSQGGVAAQPPLIGRRSLSTTVAP
jgi:hypothetical protein